MSAFSMKTWLNKGYTEEEAKHQIAIRRPTNVAYWINKGFTAEEAELKKKEHQKKGGKAFADLPKEEKQKTRTTCIQYYLEKGYSEEEAMVLQAERQKTFSKEICIEKYGEEEGIKIWQERQDKWQATLNAKPQEERDAINASKQWDKNLSSEERDYVIKQRTETWCSNWEQKTLEERIAHGRAIRERMVRAGLATPDHLIEDFAKYRAEVWGVTRCQDLHLLENIDRRGPADHHLDHKFSIAEGFKQNIDPYIIGHLMNLEMLPHLDNISKHAKCSITLEELISAIQEYDDKA